MNYIAYIETPPTTERNVMDQLAIMVNRNNVAEIVHSLDDYKSTETFLEDHGYMLDQHGTVVLVIDVVPSNSDLVVSHVVTLGMFHANAICDKLNENTFED